MSNFNDHVHFIKTDKFKDVTISVRFLSDLKERKSSARALLAAMLCDRSKKYNTKALMSEKCDQCYGASINAKTLVYGKKQAVEFKISAINEKYAQSTLFEKQIDFLKELIFNPWTNEDGSFKEPLIEEAKNNLKALIDRKKDNPSSNAMDEACRLMGKDQPLAISNLGTKEIVDSITADELLNEYRSMLEKDAPEIFVVGDFNEERAEKLIKAKLPLNYKDESQQVTYQTVCDENREENKKRAISQTTCVVLALTNTTIADEDYWAMRVGNGLFGQLPTSFLFQEIREKRSLCYSIYSSMLSYDGILSIICGIDAKQKDQVIQCIDEQLKRIQDGDFSDRELNPVKKMMCNSIQSSVDDGNSLINLAYQNTLLNQQETLDSIVDKIKSITKEDVIKAFSKVECRVRVIIEQEDQNEEMCE